MRKEQKLFTKVISLMFTFSVILVEYGRQDSLSDSSCTSTTDTRLQHVWVEEAAGTRAWQSNAEETLSNRPSDEEEDSDDSHEDDVDEDEEEDDASNC